MMARLPLQQKREPLYSTLPMVQNRPLYHILVLALLLSLSTRRRTLLSLKPLRKQQVTHSPACEKPVITQSGNIITITSTTEGAEIYYTTNGDHPTSNSTKYEGPFDKGSAGEIRAIATRAGYVNSSEAAILPPTEVSSSDEMTDMSGNYILASNFSSNASIGTSW